jgi:hypothetical protein
MVTEQALGMYLTALDGNRRFQNTQSPEYTPPNIEPFPQTGTIIRESLEGAEVAFKMGTALYLALKIGISPYVTYGMVTMACEDGKQRIMHAGETILGRTNRKDLSLPATTPLLTPLKS